MWVEADASLRGSIARIAVEREAEGLTYPTLIERFMPDDDFRVVLTPAAGDASRRFTIGVRAHDGEGEELGSIGLTSGYVANEVRHVKLILAAGCGGKPVTRAPERLGRSRVAAPALRACRDAAEATPDARARDAGPGDASADEDAGELPDAPSSDAGVTEPAADGGDSAAPDGAGATSPCERPDNPCEDLCVPSSDGRYFRCACGEGGLVKSDDFNACWSWQEPVRIEQGTGDVELSNLAMNPDGVAVAAWFQKNGAERQLWAAGYDAKGRWRTPVRIASGPTDVITGLLPSHNGPGVAVDDAGHAYVVWHEHLDTRMTMRLVTLPFDAPDAPIELPAPGEPLGWDTTIERDPTGGIYVASSGGASFAEPSWWLVHFTREAGWGAKIELAQPSDQFSGMRLGVAQTGKLGFIWSHRNETTWGSELDPLPPYTLETSEVRGSSRSAGGFELDIALDTGGNAVAVWLQASPDDLLQFDLYWSETIGNATHWFDARMRASDVYAFPAEPRVVFDGSGRNPMVWVQREGDGGRVYAARTTSRR